jgi:hypothetical protein
MAIAKLPRQYQMIPFFGRENDIYHFGFFRKSLILIVKCSRGVELIGSQSLGLHLPCPFRQASGGIGKENLRAALSMSYATSGWQGVDPG